MIAFTNTTFSFGRKPVLESVTLAISTGTRYALMGKSGSGKSTLLKGIIAAQLKSSRRQPRAIGLPALSGEYLVDWLGRIGYCPQEQGLAEWLSVRDNLAFGMRATAVPIPEDVLNGVAEDLALTPYLAMRPSQLSFGTRKRVAFARTLLTFPDLLLLDEPFVGLDYDLRLRASDVLMAFIAQRPTTAVIFATHDTSEAALFDTALVVGRHVKPVSRGTGTSDSFRAQLHSLLMAG